MKRCILAMFLAGAMTAGFSGADAAPAPPSTIAIDGGRVIRPAADAEGITSFKGLPYAAPPVGPRRWRPPAPVVPWAQPRKADTFGADCFQAVSGESPASRPRSEDCLYLNVWTPAGRNAAKLPVYVWFHGGGSRVGSGAQPGFDGSAMARKGIVVVTVNYRLGPLGFLSTPELSRESLHGASGNYGFMDDLAALRWVRRNIATFGGDPARVTIGGESSGSVTTSVLMVSPQAKGLFQRAIGESGSSLRVHEYGSMGATSLADEEAKGGKLMAALGVGNLAGMRAASAQHVLDASVRAGTFYNLPVVDGALLPDAPWRIFARHRQNDVPLLVGWNAQEGSVNLLMGRKPFSELLKGYYGAEAARIAPFYAARSEDDLQAYVRAAGDNGIAYGTWKWAYAQTLSGRQPVYAYEFDHAPPIPAGTFGPHFDVRLAGAFHGAEIPYAFDTLASRPDWAVTDVDRAIAATMSAYWVNFIKTGNPNGRGPGGAGLALWPRYTPGPAAQRMRIAAVSHAEADADFARFLAIKQAHDRIDPADPVAPTKRR
ncbi:carboxylesterase/lipase family protein [Novosphingobium rosa]|uniref:carboxylesterase/lipase family protein n=1 Tax=Novosphingobium rosa TaxID=76978 RepID=UPI000A02836F|nr:carboxylesterase family protein [Novosphingobium rosa]